MMSSHVHVSFLKKTFAAILLGALITWILAQGELAAVTVKGGGVLCNPNAPEPLTEYFDGSLGRYLPEDFVEMYGPQEKVKDVKATTITHGRGREHGVQKFGFYPSEANNIGRTQEMKHLLFSCDWLEDSDESVFKQVKWPTNADTVVRALHPGALKGEGAMVRSNLHRVYVITSTLPSDVTQGYLAVEGVKMVDKFLKDFQWESGSEGYRDSETDEGIRAPSFVVKDKAIPGQSKGYYIAARRCGKDRSRVICHLVPIGSDLLRHTRCVPPKGCKMLSKWLQENFPE